MTEVGIDLVYLPEFKQRLRQGGNQFLQHAFNKSEMLNHTTEHLAGIWAAKEAVIKASDATIEAYRDIMISYDEFAKPKAAWGLSHFAVSISHHGQYAIAIAIKDGDDLK